MNAPRFCRRCGGALAAGAKFCGGCGSPIVAGAADTRAAPNVTPAPAPAQPARKRRRWPLALAVVVALVAIAGVTAARMGVLPALFGSSAMAAVGMTLPPPAGWQEVQGENGQLMALLPEDLAQDDATGPRIQVRPADMYEDASQWLASGFAEGPVAIRNGPSEVTIGPQGRPGVELTVEETSGARSASGVTRAVVYRYVVVQLADGRAALITMEAPAHQYTAYRATFDAALSAAQFAQ